MPSGSSYSPSFLGRAQRPDQHPLERRVVQQRWLVGQSDAPRSGHRVEAEGRRGRLKRPGWVLDLAPQRALRLVDGVQAVALGQEVLERSRRGAKGLAGGAVLGFKRRRLGVERDPLALVVDEL